MRKVMVLIASLLATAAATGVAITPARAGTNTVIAVRPATSGTDVNAGGRSGALLQGADGSLYGTSEFGGDNGLGEVFQLTPPASGGASWGYTRVYSFTGGADGAYPVGGVVQSASGTLYGVTSGDELSLGNVRLSGAAVGAQTGSRLYALTQSGTAWTQTTIADFGTSAASGSLALDTAGSLYAALQHGGGVTSGSVVRISPVVGTPANSQHAQGWAFSVLYQFTDPTVGLYPQGGVTIGGDGRLYGSTLNGGDPSCHGGVGCGTVFRLTPGAALPWKLSVLQVFHGGTTGDRPSGPLLVDASGNVLGTTAFGGQSSTICTAGCGVLFSISAKGGLRTLHSFCGTRPQVAARCTEGFNPTSGLMRAQDGYFYGTASLGGSGDRAGTVFRVDPYGTFGVVTALTADTGGEPIAPLARGGTVGQFASTTSGNLGAGAVAYAVAP